MIRAIEGGGLFNSFINKLPVELHIPGYQFCGPGTKLAKRLSRGDSGINPLDKACKNHDIAYAQNEDINTRHEADKILEEKAWKRVLDKNSSVGEKISAWLVTTAMKTKRKLGSGMKRVKKEHRRGKRKQKNGGSVAFSSKVVNPIRMKSKKFSNENIKKYAKHALAIAKATVKNVGGRKKVRTPRIIPIPIIDGGGGGGGSFSTKSGGFLPFLIPLLAGLSATGALASGVSNIAKAVKDVKAAREKFIEDQRHNKKMEAIAIGKQKLGQGLFLRPYREGLGLFLKKENKKKNFRARL